MKRSCLLSMVEPQLPGHLTLSSLWERPTYYLRSILLLTGCVICWAPDPAPANNDVNRGHPAKATKYPAAMGPAPQSWEGQE